MSTSILPFLTLAGSLTPYGVLTQAEREAQQRAAELSRRTTELQNVAGQAQQQYGQAAAAPPPGYLPGDTFATQLLGVLGSVITQRPEYQEQAQAEIRQRRAALLEVRAQNLQQLRDVAMERADAAREAGNLEEEFKNRTVAEKNAKLLEVVMESQKQQFQRNERIAGEAARAKLEGANTGSEQKDKAMETRLKLVTAIRQDQQITDYAKVRQFVAGGIDAAASKSSAGDIILIRNLARASDPQTGIREEEYGTFKAAAGKVKQFIADWSSNLVGSGQLLPEGRARIVRELLNIENRSRELKDVKYEMFGVISETAGVPKREVLPEIGFHATKKQMLDAARKGQWDLFFLMARDTPELNNDPDLDRISSGAPHRYQ